MDTGSTSPNAPSSSSCNRHNPNTSNADCSTCCKSAPNPSLCQNMDEMEFERGPWQAAIDDDLVKLEKLIGHQNINPDLRDSYGYTALHYAARNGKLAASKFLLQHGANINCQTKNNGATPLHRAITSGQIEIVDFLLKKGADPDLRDNDNCTGFDRAKKGNHLEIIKILEVYAKYKTND